MLTSLPHEPLHLTHFFTSHGLLGPIFTIKYITSVDDRGNIVSHSPSHEVVRWVMRGDRENDNPNHAKWLYGSCEVTGMTTMYRDEPCEVASWVDLMWHSPNHARWFYGSFEVTGWMFLYIGGPCEVVCDACMISFPLHVLERWLGLTLLKGLTTPCRMSKPSLVGIYTHYGA